MLSHVGQNLLMFDACLFICEYVHAKLLISVCGVFLYFTLCFKLYIFIKHFFSISYTKAHINYFLFFLLSSCCVYTSP